MSATTMTHVAGDLIGYMSHQRQRCSWCGFVMVDDDLTRMAMPVEPCRACSAPYDNQAGQAGECHRSIDGLHVFDMPKPPGGFPMGALVEITVDGGFRASSVIEVDADDDGSVKVPDNACMKLPPEMTGSKVIPESFDSEGER